MTLHHTQPADDLMAGAPGRATRTALPVPSDCLMVLRRLDQHSMRARPPS